MSPLSGMVVPQSSLGAMMMVTLYSQTSQDLQQKDMTEKQSQQMM